MACFMYLFQGLKSWVALLLPLLAAVFARFSSGHGSLLISITFSVPLILLSTLFLFTFSKQKDNLIQKEVPRAENVFSPEELQQKTLFSLTEKSHDKVEEDALKQVEFLKGSKDLYSEFSSTSSSEEEDHSSDIEWPYNTEEKTPDYSDGSISDEESLIEIAIPSGQFVKDFNLNYCKLDQQTMFKKHSALDFLAGINEMNEEDNLIEIDIYMGSIKCSNLNIYTKNR